MTGSFLKNTNILVFFFITGFSWGRSLVDYLKPLSARGDLFPIIMALVITSIFLHHENLKSKIDKLPKWFFSVFTPLLVVTFLIWY